MNPQKIPMGLVVLQGQGDLTVLLVSPEITEWIEQPFAPPSSGRHSSYEEAMPPIVAAQYLAHHPGGTPSLTVGIHSYANDRALHATGTSFESISELIEHVVNNNIQIVQEYNGLIY